MIEKWCLADDKKAEHCALSYVLLTKDIPLWFRTDYFTGPSLVLARELLDQWRDSDINKNTLSPQAKETARAVLFEDPDGTEEIGAHLKKLNMLRVVGRSIVAGLNSEEDAVSIIQSIQDTASGVLTNAIDKEYTHRTALLSLVDALEKANGDTAGVPCGISAIDDCISGFEKEKVYTIGALKKTGKSRFMVWLALRLACQGQKVLLNSLEMPPIKINSLALANMGDIDSSNFGKAMNKTSMEKLKTAMGQFQDYPWKIYNHRNIPELHSRIAHEKAHDGCDYVFVDFVQRMQSVKYPNDRVREVEDISIGLANLARDEKVGMIILSQLQGSAERLPPEQVPDMSHYKESAGIAENSDCLLTMHDPNRHNSTYGKPVNLSMRIEQRYGLSGGVYGIVGNLATCSFFGCDKTHENNGGNKRAYSDF
jgi:replicative DNA helicase